MLHGPHAAVPTFDYKTLTRLLDVARPDILVLEVRRDELDLGLTPLGETA